MNIFKLYSLYFIHCFNLKKNRRRPNIFEILLKHVNDCVSAHLGILKPENLINKISATQSSAITSV